MIDVISVGWDVWAGGSRFGTVGVRGRKVMWTGHVEMDEVGVSGR